MIMIGRRATRQKQRTHPPSLIAIRVKVHKRNYFIGFKLTQIKEPIGLPINSLIQTTPPPQPAELPVPSLSSVFNNGELFLNPIYGVISCPLEITKNYRQWQKLNLFRPQVPVTTANLPGLIPPAMMPFGARLPANTGLGPSPVLQHALTRAANIAPFQNYINQVYILSYT